MSTIIEDPAGSGWSAPPDLRVKRTKAIMALAPAGSAWSPLPAPVTA